MINKVYSIFDSKVGAHLQPFFMQANGAAIRAVTELVKDKTHAFGKFPADYTLFELGTFDNSTGVFDMFPTPRSLGVCVEFMSQE